MLKISIILQFLNFRFEIEGALLLPTLYAIAYLT